MPDDESNRTLMDFEPSSDDDATHGDVAVDDGDVAAGDGDVAAGDGDVADDGAVAEGDTGEHAGGDGESETVARDPGSVSPAVSTSRFVPGGESCVSCESSTRRLWVADDADGDVVCTDCRSW